MRLRMRPLTLSERGTETPTVSLQALLTGDRGALRGRTNVGLVDYVTEICESGFPGLRGLPAAARRAQLDGYIDGIIDRDFADAGREPPRGPKSAS